MTFGIGCRSLGFDWGGGIGLVRRICMHSYVSYFVFSQQAMAVIMNLLSNDRDQVY